MKILKLSKLTLVLLLSVSLLINIGVYWLTTTYELYSGPEFSLCDSYEHSQTQGVIKGGSPFESTAHKVFTGSCGLAIDTSSVSLIRELIFSWQFIANWMVQFICLVLLICLRRLYANIRH